MKMAREGTLPKRVRRREPTYSSSDALSRISIERQKSFNHRRPGWVCRIPALREHNIFVNPTGRRGEACCRFLVVLAVGTTASPVIQHAAFAQAGPAWLEQAKADYKRRLRKMTLHGSNMRRRQPPIGHSSATNANSAIPSVATVSLLSSTTMCSPNRLSMRGRPDRLTPRPQPLRRRSRGQPSLALRSFSATP